MVRTLSGLAPVDDAAKRTLEKIPQGNYVHVEYKRPRNGSMHRRYWALVQMIYENTTLYGSAEQASDHLKLLAGHCETIQYRGETYNLPKSISFSAMNQDQFDAFWSRVVKVVCEQLMPGVNSDQVEHEILRLVGAAG